MNEQTFVITGGLGFIGRALARNLVSSTRRVVVVDDLTAFRDRPSPQAPLGVELAVGDVRDSDFLPSLLERVRPDAVFHLAARHFIPDCDRDPGGCVSINTAGSVAVLEAIAKLEPSPVCVLASSAAIYAPSIRPHRESDPAGPIDIYGLSKVWAEEAARFYAERHHLRIAVARLFNVYGPGETNPHLIPALVSQALASNVVQLGDLSTERDFVHVDDVVRAFVSMPGVAVPDQLALMNVGTGRGTSGQAVVNAVKSSLDHDIEITVDRSRLRSIDRPSLISDPTSAEHVLNWRASISFEDGIRQLVRASIAAGALV